jgi:hypothetical protein
MAVNHCRARHTPTISDNTEGPPVAILISVELTKLKQLTGGRHSGDVQKKSMRREFSAVFEKYASIFSLFVLSKVTSEKRDGGCLLGMLRVQISPNLPVMHRF